MIRLLLKSNTILNRRASKSLAIKICKPYKIKEKNRPKSNAVGDREKSKIGHRLNSNVFQKRTSVIKNPLLDSNNLSLFWNFKVIWTLNNWHIVTSRHHTLYGVSTTFFFICAWWTLSCVPFTKNFILWKTSTEWTLCKTKKIILLLRESKILLVFVTLKSLQLHFYLLLNRRTCMNPLIPRSIL